MSTASSEAAEQVIKIYLDGVEVALRISGSATKNVVAALYAISQDKNKTKGKARLTSMLKTGKELKIFSIRMGDLKKFSEEAKKYGVLYCALTEKDNKDGLVDIMVKAEDAPKINRIVERFNLNTLDTAKIEKNIENKDKTKEDLLAKEILKKSNNNNLAPSNTTVRENQSKHFLKTKNKPEEITKNELRPSVKKHLKEIDEKIKAREDTIIPKERKIINSYKDNKKSELNKQKINAKSKLKQR